MASPKIDKIDAVRLVDEKSEPIKQVPGFAKHHRVPSSNRGSDQRFLFELVHPSIDADLQQVFKALRKSYGLKRKELNVDGPHDGCGMITTPFFNYEFQATLNATDPSNVVWRRMITGIYEPARIFAGPFEDVFGKRFSILEIGTETLDLESIVDHIEDTEQDLVEVDYDKDLTWCEVQVANLKTSVLIQTNSIRAVSHKEVSPLELLKSFLQIQHEFMASLDFSGIPFLASRPGP